MRGQLKKLGVAMWRIVEDPRSRTFEKIEAAKIIAACSGVLLPDTNETFLSTKQIVELRQAKQQIAERMLRQRERRRLENRRQYLKRKLRAQGTAVDGTAAEGTDQKGQSQ